MGESISYEHAADFYDATRALSPDAQVRIAEAMSSRLRRERLGGCGCGLLAPRALVAVQEDLAEAHVVRSHLQALVFAD